LDGITIGLIILAIGFVAVDRLWLNNLAGESTATGNDQAENVSSSMAQQPSGEYPNNSIAILPFVNMSDDRANEYFSDSISEEILNTLAKVKLLKVAGRTSSFAFKNHNEDLRYLMGNGRMQIPVCVRLWKKCQRILKPNIGYRNL
jgi:hypothetical protein